MCGLMFFIPSAMAGEPIATFENQAVQSEILDEDRPYFVYLPPSYNDTVYHPRKYPVLYVLDGETFLHTVSGLVDHMGNTFKTGNMQIPELIVVAIPNTGNRDYDLGPTKITVEEDGETYSEGGGGSKFLQFIEKELIPDVEKNYRTIPHRTFTGHSLGGLTVLYSLLTQPGLFHNYVSLDGSLYWDDNLLARLAPAFVKENKNIKANIYIGGANYTSRQGIYEMVKPAARLAKLLKKSSSRYLSVKVQLFDDETHDTVPLPSLYYGLRGSFKEYAPSVDEMIEGGPKAIIKHFRTFSERTGVEFLPPEGIVDYIGDEPVSEIDIDDEVPFFKESEEYYRLNIANYPNSVHAKKKLADYMKRKSEQE